MKKLAILFSYLIIISCSKKKILIEDISFKFENNNAQPALFSNNGILSLSWISSDEKNRSILNFKQFKDGKWDDNVLKINSGNDWFVNWADFPAHAVNQDAIISSFLQKSDSGTYNYDIILNIQKLSGEIIKENFLLNTDGIKAEHGFVSITANKNEGFFISWLDGRNTLKKKLNGHHKPMSIRFAEVTNTGEIINESELDTSVCDCCQTSIVNTKNGPLVVYRNRTHNEVRDIYSVRRTNNEWQTPKAVHNDGWVINGCPVNGPKAAVSSKNIAVGWFTVFKGDPQINVSFSKSDGESFDTPIKINDYNAIGRVDIEFLNDDEIIISYMEYDDNGTYLKIKKVSDNGNISEPITISKIDGGRSTGVPQLEIINTEIFLVWTVFENGLNQLKSVKLNSISI